MTKQQTTNAGRNRIMIFLSAVTAVMLLLCTGVPQVYAASESLAVSGTVTVGDFTVTSRSGNATITGYSGSGGEITLPQQVEIQGEMLTVTGMSANTSVFKGNKKITKVTIPDGYVSIEGGAFQGCTALTEVNIPGSVSYVGFSAFEECTSLNSVTFQEGSASGLSIGMSAFKNCNLSSVTLPSRLNSLHGLAFAGNDNLADLNLAGESVTFAAADGAVYDLTGESGAELVAYAPGRTAAEFTVPDTIADKPVTSIGLSAFRYHENLQKVTLPASVTEINSYAFEAMTALKELALKTETPPTLAANACTNLPEGSKIIVENQEVADAFACPNPEELWPTYYYTEDRTTVEIRGGGTENPDNVSAVVSIEAQPALSEGSAVYEIYLNEAENITTVLLKIAFDPSQVNQGTLSCVSDQFDVSSSSWNEEDGRLVLKAYLGKTGDTGYTSEEKTKIAEIRMPVKENISGKITAELTKAACAGITTEDESAMEGATEILPPSSAFIVVENCDVNGDGEIDIVDIAEAQRHYRLTSENENWETAKKCDVNSDGKIDIEDFIAIFLAISDL